MANSVVVGAQAVLWYACAACIRVEEVTAEDVIWE